MWKKMRRPKRLHSFVFEKFEPQKGIVLIFSSQLWALNFLKNSFQTKGEKYTLLNKENESWYLIKDKQGNSGFAPATYLEFIDDNFKDPINKLDKSHYGKE